MGFLLVVQSEQLSMLAQNFFSTWCTTWHISWEKLVGFLFFVCFFFFKAFKLGLTIFFLLLLGSTSPLQDDQSLSPQHPRSPFPDALLSSTSCTSAPLSPTLLDLGVDIQAELEKDVSELDLTLLDPQGKKRITLCCSLHLTFLLPPAFLCFFLSLISALLMTNG